jgi:hypothetical protein
MIPDERKFETRWKFRGSYAFRCHSDHARFAWEESLLVKRKREKGKDVLQRPMKHAMRMISLHSERNVHGRDTAWRGETRGKTALKGQMSSRRKGLDEREDKGLQRRKSQDMRSHSSGATILRLSNFVKFQGLTRILLLINALRQYIQEKRFYVGEVQVGNRLSTFSPIP